MFIALDTNKQRVSVENADNGEYFCPVCNEILSLKAKNSMSVRPHFAHKKGSECLDDWKHDMSEWHYNWQSQFPAEYREVVVEKDGKKHRADVLINNCVIEFQHSPISGEEIKERNDFYTGCGYQVIWVFDANGKIHNSAAKDGSIDPYGCQSGERLEWKRARGEFKDQNREGVFYFVEYNTMVSADPSASKDIMLLLTELHPKEIKFREFVFPNRYNGNQPMWFYIQRENFLGDFLPNNQSVLTVRQMEQATNYYKRIKSAKQNQSLMSAPVVLQIPQTSRKRKFRF